MTDAELQPCPFCASTGDQLDRAGNDDYGQHWVECDHCRMTGPVAADAETARQLWNRRVQKQSTTWLELAEARQSSG